MITVLAFLAPIQSMLIAVMSIVIVDLITGLLVARKQKKPITSRGLRRSISKLIIYQVAIILAFIVETYLTKDLVPLIKIVTTFIGLTELTSVFENLNILSEKNLLKSIIDKLASARSDAEKKIK